MNFGPVAKAVNGTVVAFVSALIAALFDGSVSTSEWIGIAITTVVAAVLVFQAANYRVAYAKAIAGALTAALGSLGTAATGGLDHVTLAQWLTVLVALLGNFFVVSQTPNAVVSDTPAAPVV